MPRVTVLMPVYNGAKYIAEAIESVLSQTFTDFEFLIINDGSTDNTQTVIKQYPDPRIRLVTNPKNLQLIATLNKGLDLARGEYIIRMDSDDRCLPERFTKQVKFMDAHPEVGICGTWSVTMGEGITPWETHWPSEHNAIRTHLLMNTAISHPTTIFRRSLFEQHKLKYDSQFLHVEDYELWARAADLFKVANLPEVLLAYRVHASQISAPTNKVQQINADQVRTILLNKLGIEPTPVELAIFNRINNQDFKADLAYLKAVSEWLTKLYNANAQTKRYRQQDLQALFKDRWFSLLLNNRRFGLNALKVQLKNSMFRRDIRLNTWKIYLKLLYNQWKAK